MTSDNLNKNNIQQGFILSAPFFFMLVIVLFVTRILVWGYLCYRGDHLTQISLLYYFKDPSLFAKEYLLLHAGHLQVRFFYLYILHFFSTLTPIYITVFVIYFMSWIAGFYSWTGLAKNVYKNTQAAALIFLLLIVFQKYGGICKNHIFDIHMIARVFTYIATYWSILLILQGRIVLAGFLCGLGGLFQPAISFQFAIVCVPWLFALHGRKGIIESLKFLILMTVVLLPISLVLKTSAYQENVLSDDMAIQILAYIRHPEIMIPHLFGAGGWISFTLVFLVSVINYKKLAAQYPEMTKIAVLIMIIAAVLCMAAFFIELYPVKRVIEFQFFRLAFYLRLLVYLLLTGHLLNLYETKQYQSRLRLSALIFSGMSENLLISVFIAELLIYFVNKFERVNFKVVNIFFILIAMGINFGESSNIYISMFIIFISLYKHFIISPGTSLSTKIISVATPALTALSVLFLIVMLFYPFEKTIQNGETKSQRKMAQFCDNYQIRPFPIKAIEKAGEWAEKNTDKNSLFLIPPQLQANGFQVWARRAIVFQMKTIAFNNELNEWYKRYLDVRGVNENDKVKVKEVLHDIGGEKAARDYRKLSEEQILALSKKYDVDYIVSEHAPPYQSPYMKIVHETEDLDVKDKDDGRLYIYQIIK